MLRIIYFVHFSRYNLHPEARCEHILQMWNLGGISAGWEKRFFFCYIYLKLKYRNVWHLFTIFLKSSLHHNLNAKSLYLAAGKVLSTLPGRRKRNIPLRIYPCPEDRTLFSKSTKHRKPLFMALCYSAVRSGSKEGKKTCSVLEIVKFYLAPKVRRKLNSLCTPRHLWTFHTKWPRVPFWRRRHFQSFFKYHSLIEHPGFRWKGSVLSASNAKALLCVRIAAWTVKGRVPAITADISSLLSPSLAPLAFNSQALPKGQADIFKRKMPFWEALFNYPRHTHTHTDTQFHKEMGIRTHRAHTHTGRVTFISSGRYTRMHNAICNFCTCMCVRQKEIKEQIWKWLQQH